MKTIAQNVTMVHDFIWEIKEFHSACNKFFDGDFRVAYNKLTSSRIFNFFHQIINYFCLSSIDKNWMIERRNHDLRANVIKIEMIFSRDNFIY